MTAKATSVIVLLLAGLVLFGCGGREARPVAKTTSFDDQLSCAHLESQLEVNETRLSALGLEAQGVADANAIRVIFVAPFHLDLSGAQQTEIEALQGRNMVLTDLAEKKDCAWLAERQAAVEAEALEATVQEGEEESAEETVEAAE